MTRPTTARRDAAAGRRPPPERTCVGCRTRRPKTSLVRLALAPGGALAVDATGKGSGRGAYLCRRRACWAVKGLAPRVGHALRTPLTMEHQAQLAAMADRLCDEDEVNGVDGGREAV
ncbi:DUF448 domain-containing protein [bacterium]|nr:YlxR family protein [Chloroflexi bacterium CFX6]RIL08255.1 MAG: DUF448 domain-containing protein [bacterium]